MVALHAAGRVCRGISLLSAFASRRPMTLAADERNHDAIVGRPANRLLFHTPLHVTRERDREVRT